VKRILVGLDGSSWSSAAVAEASDMAKRTGAVLTGVAIIDHRGIEEAVGPAPLGADYFARLREERLTGEARAHVSRLVVEFRDACERSGVLHFEIQEEGVPFERLVHDSLGQDLLVLGLRTYFHFPPSDKPSPTLEKVLRHGVRPVLAVRQQPGPIRRVAVALDASAPAARTLQLFTLLNPWELETVRLLHAGGDRRQAGDILRAAAGYLQAHGVRSEPVHLEGAAREAIPDYISSQDLDLVVMGAYGKTRVGGLLFGSLTKTLLEQPRASLFLAH
jgi:nucleotide-binding universal stress UspA family protein